MHLEPVLTFKSQYPFFFLFFFFKFFSLAVTQFFVNYMCLREFGSRSREKLLSPVVHRVDNTIPTDKSLYSG